MPAKLAVDYDAAKSLYIKGLTLSEISQKTGIPATALRQRSTRYKWSTSKTECVQAMSHSVQDSLKSSATKWVTKIDSFVNKALDRLNPDDLSLRDLERAVQIANTADQMARRTYGLDSEHSKHSINLSVNVSSQEHSALGQVIDIPQITDKPEGEQSGQ